VVGGGGGVMRVVGGVRGGGGGGGVGLVGGGGGGGGGGARGAGYAGTMNEWTNEPGRLRLVRVRVVGLATCTQRTEPVQTCRQAAET